VRLKRGRGSRDLGSLRPGKQGVVVGAPANGHAVPAMSVAKSAGITSVRLSTEIAKPIPGKVYSVLPERSMTYQKIGAVS